jgi:hypothetical protein
MGGGLSGTTSNPMAGAQGGSAILPGSPTAPGAGAVAGATGVTTVGGPQVAGGSTPTTSQRLASNEPIRLGVLYTPGADQAFAAAGIKGLTTGDTKAEAEAVVAWIRAHGGLGGHPIQVFAYAMDMSASSAEAAQEEACTAMTQDYKVRYVLTIQSLAQVMMPCLAKAGVGMLDDETSLGDATMAKFADFLGNPGEIAPGRIMSVMVEDLWRRGWLTSRSKVGILAADRADSHAVVDGPLTASLRRHGLTATTQYVNPDGGDGGSAQSSSATLKYRSAGVDRIITVPGYSPLFAMEAASSQGYHPAYSMFSTLGPGALLETAAPKDQLANSAGIGWQPYLDIGAGKRPGPVSNRETLCFDIMKKAGQASSSATAQGFQVLVCNLLFYLKDLSDRVPSMPRDLLTSGRVLLGKSFVSADTFLTDVTHRTDGVAGYRSVLYQENCSCFQYVSPVQSTS